jgi:hypothetical protein
MVGFLPPLQNADRLVASGRCVRSLVVLSALDANLWTVRLQEVRDGHHSISMATPR